jgi:predicted metal-dependent phosphoesterase TrpH
MIIIGGFMKYDLHVHSHYSACSMLKAEDILRVAKKIGLNGVVVADHNTIRGGVEAKRANKDRDFEVIPGIEVSTDRGHVLGLYVNKDVRSRDFFKVSEEIRKQGGLVILAHPFRILPHLRAKVKDVNLRKYLDGLECYNGRTSYFSNKHAISIADKYSLSKTGGSDAHFSFEIGRCRTICEGGIANAIRKGRTSLEGSYMSGLPGSILSGLLKMATRRW